MCFKIEMKTNQCKKCPKRYRILTKEGLCASCYKEEFNRWPAEFTGGKEGMMAVKFKKHGGKKKKKKR